MIYVHHYYLYYTDIETEDQRSPVTCLRLHSYQVIKSQYKPRAIWSLNNAVYNKTLNP